MRHQNQTFCTEFWKYFKNKRCYWKNIDIQYSGNDLIFKRTRHHMREKCSDVISKSQTTTIYLKMQNEPNFGFFHFVEELEYSNIRLCIYIFKFGGSKYCKCYMKCSLQMQILFVWNILYHLKLLYLTLIFWNN